MKEYPRDFAYHHHRINSESFEEDVEGEDRSYNEDEAKEPLLDLEVS